MDIADLKFSGSLSLADNTSWDVAEENDCGGTITKTLAKTMQLGFAKRTCQHLLIVKNGIPFRSKHSLNYFSLCKDSLDDHQKTVLCQLPPAENNDELARQLMKVSLIFCNQAEVLGGVLIHGALAKKNGQGIIMAGHGDIGKTTASCRLPPPWKSLSDDCTLIVRDREGTYHAHPWPTWSTFMFGGTGGTWNVQQSVPLKAIFILKQNNKDYIEPLGQGQAACLLNETADQAWLVIWNDLDYKERRIMHLQRFENICELTKKIPAHLLHISKTGTFWEEMEKVL